ncbi:MAG: T9SS type A sorting domain-containing protein [Prevotellaceae bacterium]|jgi:hypothetical protein|nr:T9SS type A sorting domain-containing protein [Prevotellaceae bacterium]
MKTKILFLCTIFLLLKGTIQIKAEEYPLFPVDNAQWRELVVFDYELPDDAAQPSSVEILYTLQGDTLVENIRRGKLYFSFLSGQNSKLIGFIHTDNGKVYFRAAVEKVELADSYILLCDDVRDSEDILLYDFTLEINDAYRSCAGEYVLSNVESATLNNAERKQYQFISSPYSLYSKFWIEGMGSTRNLFDPVTLEIADMYYKGLISFSQNGEVVEWGDKVEDKQDTLPQNLEDALYPDSANTTQSNQVQNTFIKLYPNPMVEASLYVRSSLPMEQIHVYDLQGSLILSVNAQGLFQYQLDGAGLAVGVYFIKIILQNKLFGIKKLIVN